METQFIRFVDVSEGEKSEKFVQINERHLEVFRTSRTIAPRLFEEDEAVRQIAADEGAKIDIFERAWHMHVPLPGQPVVLPYNQCIRWQLLRYCMTQLDQLEKSFGSWHQDKHLQSRE